MSSQRDPEKILAKHLHNIEDLANARVLEIGVGDGHLTWCYASAAKHVIGIDPNANRLVMALRKCPLGFARLSFAKAKAEALPFQGKAFDVAIMSWTL